MSGGCLCDCAPGTATSHSFLPNKSMENKTCRSHPAEDEDASGGPQPARCNLLIDDTRNFCAVPKSSHFDTEIKKRLNCSPPVWNTCEAVGMQQNALFMQHGLRVSWLLERSSDVRALSCPRPSGKILSPRLLRKAWLPLPVQPQGPSLK